MLFSFIVTFSHDISIEDIVLVPDFVDETQSLTHATREWW
jgi:hypothetical protein